MQNIINILNTLQPITLKEMKSIRLMNRIDSKYIINKDTLASMLLLAADEYMVQDIDGDRCPPYSTVYLDTPDKKMYMMHQSGRSVREKIRIRTYESSNISFLEVKHKNNKGRTDKRRIAVNSRTSIFDDGGDEFISENSWFNLSCLTMQLENHFHRITLVNNERTERLTIDMDIQFHNIYNDQNFNLDELVVVELKRDGRTYSPIRRILQQLRVQPSGFSKYCIGCVLTDPKLKQNRIRPRIRKILKLNGNIN